MSERLDVCVVSSSVRYLYTRAPRHSLLSLYVKVTFFRNNKLRAWLLVKVEQFFSKLADRIGERTDRNLRFYPV